MKLAQRVVDYFWANGYKLVRDANARKAKAESKKTGKEVTPKTPTTGGTYWFQFKKCWKRMPPEGKSIGFDPGMTKIDEWEKKVQAAIDAWKAANPDKKEDEMPGTGPYFEGTALPAEIG